MKPLPWITLALSLTTARAWAQTTTQSDEYARLRVLAQEASDRGQYAEALAHAERAAAIRMEPALRRFIAVMHVELGPDHLPAAVENADLCVRESQASENPEDRRDTLGVCQRMSTELGRQVARVVVRVPSPAPPDLRVRVQGVALDASRWGSPLAVLPGRVRVEASAGDAVLFQRDLEVAAGQREAVEVPAPAPRPTAAVTVRTPHAPRREPPARSPVPWIVAGAGAALAITGNLFILARDAAVNERDAFCPGGTCPSPDAQARAGDADDTARAWQTAAYVTAGVGAAALVGGIVWGVLDLRRERPRQASWSPSLRASSEGALVGLTGSF